MWIHFTTNAEIWFSSGITVAGPCPAVDLARSCAQREDFLVTPAEQAGRRALREKLRSLSTDEATRYVWDQLGAFASNHALLAKPAGDALRPREVPPKAGGTTTLRSFWKRLFR